MGNDWNFDFVLYSPRFDEQSNNVVKWNKDIARYVRIASYTGLVFSYIVGRFFRRSIC